MKIDFQTIQIAVIFVFFIAIAWLLAEFKGMKDEIKERLGINNETIKLQLQAYERLALYAERASLKNLVSRLTTSGITASQLQADLLETLRTEYEYNVSQQIYVSPELWKAINKLKDQNSYIINQLASTLSAGSSGMDLSRVILEYSMTKNAELNQIILEAIRFESKKLL